MNLNNYRFLAIFTKSDEIYEVEFPDIKNCFTFGLNLDEAIENAKDVLKLILLDMKDQNIPIPNPSQVLNIKINENQMLMPVEISITK